MNRKIKSLLIIPGKEPQLVKIPASSKFIKSLVGYNLQKIKLNNDVTLIANKNARIDDANRVLGDSVILGTFLILNTKNNVYVGLNKRQINRYSNSFLLKKHQIKIDLFKDEYFRNLYSIKNSKALVA